MVRVRVRLWIGWYMDAQTAAGLVGAGERK